MLNNKKIKVFKKKITVNTKEFFIETVDAEDNHYFFGSSTSCIKIIITSLFIIFLLTFGKTFINFTGRDKEFIPQKEILSLRGDGGAKAGGGRRVYMSRTQPFMASQKQLPKKLTPQGRKILKERDAYIQKRMKSPLFEHYVDTVQ